MSEDYFEIPVEKLDRKYRSQSHRGTRKEFNEYKERVSRGDYRDWERERGYDIYGFKTITREDCESSGGIWVASFMRNGERVRAYCRKGRRK